MQWGQTKGAAVTLSLLAPAQLPLLDDVQGAVTWPGPALHGSSSGDYKSSWNDFAFCLGANSPNYHDKATLYADVSLFLKIQVALMNAWCDILWWQAEECWDQELLKWENHSPKLLFYFLLIKFGRERIELKSTGNASIQEPFKAPANGNHEEHIGKRFANFPMHRALYLHSMATVAGLHTAPSVNVLWGLITFGKIWYLFWNVLCLPSCSGTLRWQESFFSL